MHPQATATGEVEQPVFAERTFSLRSEAVLAGIIIALVYAALGFLQPFAAGTLADDGVYLAVGKSLADGTGYRNIHLVGEPPNTNYPPVLPVLFAAVWTVAGTLGAVLTAVIWMNLFVCGAAAALLWSVARRRLQLTRPVAALFVLAPLLLDASFFHYRLALSEPYFLLGWAAVLWLYYRVNDADATRASIAWAALLGLATVAVAGVRLQAIGLFPAVAVALLIERNRRSTFAAYLAGAFAPLLLVATLGEGARLVDRIASAPHFGWMATGNIAMFARFAGDAISHNFFIYQLRLVHHTSGVPLIAYTLVAIGNLLVAAGALYLLRRHAVIALTFISNALIVLIWPFNDLRLMVVTLPFAGMVAASGVDLLVRSASARARIALLAICCIVTLPVVLRQFGFYRASATSATTSPPRTFTLGYALRRNSEVVTNTAEWVRQHTSPEDRVMVAQTAGVFLHSGRKTVESNPPQSVLRDVGPAPFAIPGAYLTSVLLSEGVTVLVLEYGGLRVGRDAEVVERACPNVLQRRDNTPADTYPAHYRIDRDEVCLRRLLHELTTAR